MHFSLNDHYTSIKTQSNKLERVNILQSDILKIELEENTLSNSGQHNLTIYCLEKICWTQHLRLSLADRCISRLMTTVAQKNTQSHKLERINILNFDILNIELEETTLSNSGQLSLTT